MSIVNDRIAEMVDYFGDRKSFVRAVGLNKGTLNNIIAGRRSKPSFEILSKIIATCVNVNVNWLMAGRGEMLVDKKIGLFELPFEGQAKPPDLENENYNLNYNLPYNLEGKTPEKEAKEPPPEGDSLNADLHADFEGKKQHR